MYLYLRAFIGVLAVLLMVAGGPARSQQGRRIALVVGNSAYDADGPLSLPFSRNNADDVAKALERLNFEVIRKYNLDWAEFDSSLSDLQQRSSDAAVVLFYYSGHAMHFDGRSYLMPINAKLESKRSLAFQMISIEDDVVGRAMGDTARKIVIIDAPPNNLVADQYAMRFDPRHDVRNVRGLAPPPPLEGLLVADAKPLNTLATRKGGKSQYVEALTRVIGKPGLEIRALLDAVASDVRKETNNKQIPIYNAPPTWTDFYFVPPNPGEQAARERAAREQAAKDQAAREQAAKDQAARDQAAKDQAAKDQAAREQAARDQAAKEQAARDQAAKDQAAKDQAAKDQAAKDQAARDQAAKDQAARDQAAREQAAKDQAAREQASKDQAAREQAAKDQAAKDQVAKDQAARDQAAKDQAAKDQAARNQAAKDQAAKDQVAKDQAAKDQAAKDQAVRDQAAKDQAAKDQGAKKPPKSDKASGVREAERKKAEKRQRAKEDAAAKRETASRPARGDRGGDTRRALRDRDNQSRKAASRSRPERRASPPAYVSAPTEAPPRAVESQGCSGCGF